MVTAVCWKWGQVFGADHVNALAAALHRQLRLPHELVCITDDPSGLDRHVRVVPMPPTFAQTPRCRRRMQGFSAEMSSSLGARLLYLDLDMVIVDDITALVDRPEPIVGWRVGHARVISGAFLLANAGALDGAWRQFHADPEGFPQAASPLGIGSDQAMVNLWLRQQPRIAEWTEADGFVTYFGDGYADREHLGIGPNQPVLPAGARVVVLGSADLHVLSQGDVYPWVRHHWGAGRAA